jgi:hypothetical protein
MYGYIDQSHEKITLGLCGSEIFISDHMYRGAMFNVTFYSKDWEHPTADKIWKYPKEYVYLQIWKDGQQITGYGAKWDSLTGKWVYRAAGSEYYTPDGVQYYHNGRTAPNTNGVPTRVVSAYRVWTGNAHWNFTQPTSGPDSWVNRNESWVTLWYEGQNPYHNRQSDRRLHTDNEIGLYPTSFESGTYEFVGLTYGYVMQMDPVTRTAKRFQVGVNKGTIANIPIKLVQGVQIPVIVRFKHENIFEHLRQNSSVRIRVFDDQNALVGEWLTSSSINGTAIVTGVGATADEIIKGIPLNRSAGMPLPYTSVRNVLGPGYTFVGDTGVLETVNYVPRSTMMLNVTICGIPDPYASGYGAFWGSTSGVDRVFRHEPWAPGKYGAPGAPYGISGDPFYMGGYTIETEVVPFGRDVDNRHSKVVTIGTRLQVPYKVYDGWYPTIAGLLYGESCAIDPKTGALYPWSIVPNHVGPYQQRIVVAIPSAHLGGEASCVFELDRLGLARGVVYTYTWCDDWRTTSWVNVLFSGAAGDFNYYTFDGVYEAYLPGQPKGLVSTKPWGTWSMRVYPWLTDRTRAMAANAPGLRAQEFTLAISDGQVGGYNVYLEETGVPIPEFPTALVVLASALAAALSILRKRRK